MIDITPFTLDLKYLKETVGSGGGHLEIHKADFVEESGFRFYRFQSSVC